MSDNSEYLSIIAELEQNAETREIANTAQLTKQITLNEALNSYDLVKAVHDPVNGSYVVMAERNPKLDINTAFKEMGYVSPSPFTSWTRDERVPELRDQTGIRTYYNMKRADGIIRGALRLLKTPVMAARWFIEPASDSTLDKSIADFVERNLFEELNAPWYRVLEDALLMCEYGYMPLEKVYGLNSDGKIVLKKLAPRHPLDIMQWEYDTTGGPNGIVMEPTQANNFESIFVPIEKLVVFVLEQEAGDMRGISILRSAYKHYYYKDTLYKIDAIQKERHGIGVPIIKIPLGASDKDRALADDLGRNLRTNERAHISLPMNWEVMFAKLEGQPVDCLPSIAHHNDQIMQNILANFYKDPSAKEDSMNMFYKGTRYIASTLAETFNRHVIKQLVDFNYNRGKYPILRVRRIGENEDLRTWSFAFRNLVGANAIFPDDPLEDFLRTELDLPPADKKTARTPFDPRQQRAQEPGPPGTVGSLPTQTSPGNTTNPANNTGLPHVGLPRQKAQPPVKPPQKNAGSDRSGG
jgi:hypothetical protein